jgi:hypothetical protein
MPQDAPPNGGACDDARQGSLSQVVGMQAKPHRWAAADPGRRFDDLFNFAHDRRRWSWRSPGSRVTRARTPPAWTA